MKYLPEILTFILWPIVIIVSYYFGAYVVRRFEKKHGADGE